MDEVSVLARFAVGTRFADLPTTVVARARAILRDTVGVILGGMIEPEVQALADHAVSKHPGTIPLLGHPGTTTTEWAVLVHATAGNTLEMDEGHAFASGHAAIHAVPTALALAQQQGQDGKAFAASLVVGYEVAARAGVATTLREAVHPFGTWGVLGAAAVAARARGLDANAVAGVLELAASYAIAPSFATALQGATVRNTYAGVVNRLGLLAADLYSLGFRGERGGLSTTFGVLLGERFDPEVLVEGLGERFEIMRGYFKPYSACRYTHAAVDAALLLLEAGVERDAIESVLVETYAMATRLADPLPQTPLAARFSIPFVVASTLRYGSAGPEMYSPERLSDPAILDLAARTEVREDSAFSAMTPARRPARLILRLRGGQTLQQPVIQSKGDPELPMSEDELRQKFTVLAGRCLASEQVEPLWQLLGEVESMASMDALGGRTFLD